MTTPLLLAALRVLSSTNSSWPVGSWVTTVDNREPSLGFARMGPWSTGPHPETMTFPQAVAALEDLTRRYGHCAIFEIVKFQEVAEP